MKYSNFHITLILTFFLLFSCTDNYELPNPEVQYVPNLEVQYDCEFIEDENTKDGIMDNTEREIFKECRENKLTLSSTIESNLIGEWELIGFVDGWRSNVTQPCGYIIITKDELIFDFENESINSVSTHQWHIENLLLKVNPVNPHLSMNTFCDQYMYGIHFLFGVFALDVDQYIYVKVK